MIITDGEQKKNKLQGRNKNFRKCGNNPQDCYQQCQYICPHIFIGQFSLYFPTWKCFCIIWLFRILRHLLLCGWGFHSYEFLDPWKCQHDCPYKRLEQINKQFSVIFQNNGILKAVDLHEIVPCLINFNMIIWQLLPNCAFQAASIQNRK